MLYSPNGGESVGQELTLGARGDSYYGKRSTLLLYTGKLIL
jgi:hypothetical protein